MPQNIQGTFVGAFVGSPGATSDALVVPSGTTEARLTLNGRPGGVDSVMLQRSLDSGQTWQDQETYAVPSSAAVAVAHGEQWRLKAVDVPTQPVYYSLSVEALGPWS